MIGFCRDMGLGFLEFLILVGVIVGTGILVFVLLIFGFLVSRDNLEKFLLGLVFVFLIWFVY